jgi:hypothetical protein
VASEQQKVVSDEGIKVSSVVCRVFPPTLNPRHSPFSLRVVNRGGPEK